MKGKIIKVSTQNFIGKVNRDLRHFTYDIYNKNIKGSSVINTHLNIEILFTRLGGDKTVFGGMIYYKKAALISHLKEIAKNAVYNNWGDRKTKDNHLVVGYLNFKCKVSIDDKVELVHFVVQMRKDGKFYYTTDVNKVK